MINAMRFVNVSGNQVLLNTDTMPLRRFTTEVDIRAEELERAREHGLWDTPEFLGKRMFHLEGDIFGETGAEWLGRRQELVKAVLPHAHLGHLRVGTLYMTLEGMTEELSADCSLDGWPDIPTEGISPARSSFLLNLRANDPRLYGPERTTNVYAPTAPPGVTFNVTFNLSFPSGGAAGQVIVTNSGSLEVWPIVTMYGPGSAPFIRRIPTGEFVQVDVSLPLSSDYVEVDFKKRTAITNNGDDVYDQLLADNWFPLEPGDTILEYSAPNVYSPAYATVKWRNAYML